MSDTRDSCGALAVPALMLVQLGRACGCRWALTDAPDAVSVAEANPSAQRTGSEFAGRLSAPGLPVLSGVMLGSRPRAVLAPASCLRLQCRNSSLSPALPTQ